MQAAIGPQDYTHNIERNSLSVKRSPSFQQSSLTIKPKHGMKFKSSSFLNLPIAE